jgi:hypothetical protein
MKSCKKCDYEWTSDYIDDDGNEFIPSHYCNDNTFYNCDTEQWEDDDTEEFLNHEINKGVVK